MDNHSVVSGDVNDRIGKSRFAVKYAEQQEAGGKYYAKLEVFQQLHCLVSPPVPHIAYSGMSPLLRFTG